LGLRLIGSDEQLQAAIRRELERAREPVPQAGGGPARRSTHAVDELEIQRRKLLRLYYDDQLGADLFAEEEARITKLIEVARSETDLEQAVVQQADDVKRSFDEVAQVLGELDVDRSWEVATTAERRVLIEEFVESITVLPDHLEVTIAGAPRLNVLFEEVGLKKSQISGVGGAFATMSTPVVWRTEWAA
jgi:hypothetical protein